MTAANRPPLDALSASLARQLEDHAMQSVAGAQLLCSTLETQLGGEDGQTAIARELGMHLSRAQAELRTLRQQLRDVGAPPVMQQQQQQRATTSD